MNRKIFFTARFRQIYSCFTAMKDTRLKLLSLTELVICNEKIKIIPFFSCITFLFVPTANFKFFVEIYVLKSK